LRAINNDLSARPGGQPEHGSLTVSLISGGTGINVVPERCVVGYDRRVTPGQTSAGALAEIDAALDRVRESRPDLRIERLVPWLEGDSLSTSPESRIVGTASAVCTGLGLDSAPARVPYGSDASRFQTGGIPTIVFGPGSIAQAHGAGEFVPVSELVAATAFYQGVARSFGKASADDT
jgi:acetylornithine deacetylase